MVKRALITGIVGQDGAYLAQFLLSKGYVVYGAYRRSSLPVTFRLRELGIEEEVLMVPLDLLEFSNIQRTLENIRPDEIYNLGAQSFVHASFEQPIYTGDVNALGTVRLLESIRLINPKIKFYQASTSEMFGKVCETPQTEKTPFYPRSPYGVSKLYAHWATINYREAYDIPASSGILFNHESPLRGAEFVTRKITIGLARIRNGLDDCLELGNIRAKRDWGFAGDYVQGMWKMLQQDRADDFILATGETHSVREFVDIASRGCGFDLEWDGNGLETRAIDRKSNKVMIKIDPRHFRPAEVDILTGDASKARRVLGWEPKVVFKELVEMMIQRDLKRVKDKEPL